MRKKVERKAQFPFFSSNHVKYSLSQGGEVLIIQRGQDLNQEITVKNIEDTQKKKKKQV